MMLARFEVLSDPKRCFTWCGHLPRLNSTNRYCVELKTFVQPKGNTGKIQKNLLHNEHKKAVVLHRDRLNYYQRQRRQQVDRLYRKHRRESGLDEYWRVHEAIAPQAQLEVDEKNTLVWKVLLASPPTHQIAIYCKPPGSNPRPIFVMSLNFRGLRCNPLQAAYLCMQHLVAELNPIASNWCLVRSDASSAFYQESIEARCRDLLPIVL